MPQLVSELELPFLDTVGMERQDAIDAIEAARARHWLARTEVGYSVTRYADVTAILRDKRFHSALSMLPRMSGIEDSGYMAQRRQSILSMEGEEHARLRRLVAPAFTPASANRLRPTMREVVGELVDRFADRGECELVADVCEPYPIPIICELLGAPPQDWKLFSGWATDIFRIFNANLVEDLPLIEKAAGELSAYVSDMIAERRKDPREDLLSDLIAVEEEGDRLSTEEMAMLAEAVLMAGTDTTRNQLADHGAHGRAKAVGRRGREGRRDQAAQAGVFLTLHGQDRLPSLRHVPRILDAGHARQHGERRVEPLVAQDGGDVGEPSDRVADLRAGEPVPGAGGLDGVDGVLALHPDRVEEGKVELGDELWHVAPCGRDVYFFSAGCRWARNGRIKALGVR